VQVERNPETSAVTVTSFGHGGSDGTLAWADLSTGLIGVYLTQSRGSGTGNEFRRLVRAAVER
jgi:CubicO group peptidase (beta-lactamase class C family)